MSVIYVPIVDKSEYQAFLRLVGNDFPDTYDRWLTFARDLAHEVNRDNRVETLEIEVKAGEFAGYLKATRAKPYVYNLYTFAAEKGEREYA